jgi:hypothetical protein
LVSDDALSSAEEPASAARTRATSTGAADEVWSRAPVTPMTLVAYTKPRQAATVCATRRSVDEGATRKTRSSP